MLSSYEKLSTKVAKIQSELEKAKTNMMKDIVLFDNLYQKIWLISRSCSFIFRLVRKS